MGVCGVLFGWMDCGLMIGFMWDYEGGMSGVILVGMVLFY